MWVYCYEKCQTVVCTIGNNGCRAATGSLWLFIRGFLFIAQLDTVDHLLRAVHLHQWPSSSAFICSASAAQPYGNKHKHDFHEKYPLCPPPEPRHTLTCVYCMCRPGQTTHARKPQKITFHRGQIRKIGRAWLRQQHAAFLSNVEPPGAKTNAILLLPSSSVLKCVCIGLSNAK